MTHEIKASAFEEATRESDRSVCVAEERRENGGTETYFAARLGRLRGEKSSLFEYLRIGSDRKSRREPEIDRAINFMRTRGVNRGLDGRIFS